MGQSSDPDLIGCISREHVLIIACTVTRLFYVSGRWKRKRKGFQLARDKWVRFSSPVTEGYDNLYYSALTIELRLFMQFFEIEALPCAVWVTLQCCYFTSGYGVLTEQ